MTTWRSIKFAEVRVDRYDHISRRARHALTYLQRQAMFRDDGDLRWSQMTLGQLADEGERFWVRVPNIGPKAIEIIKAIIDDAAAGVDVTAPPPDQAYQPRPRESAV